MTPRGALALLALLACTFDAGGAGEPAGPTQGSSSSGATTQVGPTTGAGTTGEGATTETTTTGGTTGMVATSPPDATTGGSSSGGDTCAEVASYVDEDGDGYGDDDSRKLGCAIEPGHAPIGGDCDDDEPMVHPGQPETCGLGDDDCDGLVDEYDEFGNAQCGVCTYLMQQTRLYAFCQGTLGWGAARTDCMEKGLDLAIVVDGNEHKWIVAQPPIDSGLWWLGARDNDQEGKFRWLDTTPIDPADPRWAMGEPDNKGTNNSAADCLGVVAPGTSPDAGRWTDEDCSRNRAWICEGALP